MILNLIGREKIFTDVKEITRDNVLTVLRKAYAKHRINAFDMQCLIDYEAGIQPLPFEKIVRADIDIQTCDNMANYVTEFKKGYFWGTPPIYTQRGNKEHHNTDTDVDSSGISALNEMMLNGLSIGRERQKLADFVEKVGIGHVIVNPKKDWNNEMTKGAYAEVFTLDSRCAFVVYYRGIGHKKAMGVTYAKRSGKIYYSCFTDKMRGNDIKFPEDENGNPIKPQSGQWLLTYTGGEGNNPKIEPMSSTFDSSPTLTAIDDTRNEILKKCFVPMQYSSEGGGSTGIASSLSAGWDAAAVDAMREEQLVCGADRELLVLLIKAISLSDPKELPEDDPLRNIHSSDIDIKYTRRQNWDISTKSNAYATLVSHGVNGRHALKVANMFEDVEQVYIDSKEGIDEYQKKTYGETETSGNDRLMQDSSDQASQSPIVDGPQTDRTEQAE